MTGRFDDVLAGTAWAFGAPDRVLRADTLEQVGEVVSAVDGATRSGAWAWGYLAYEAAPAFDSALHVRAPKPDGPPLACFAIGSAPVLEPIITAPAASRGVGGTWQLGWDAEEHRQRVTQVQSAVAAGEAYQVNLTTRLQRDQCGDPLEFYAALVHAQRGAYNAYLDLGRHVILSASPELFFLWNDDGITVRPMKGTAPRGSTNAEDIRIAAELRSSIKQRAENIMIVDLLRNDLSRVARVGSVRVTSLLDIEPYETVLQLTSTVTAAPAPDTTLLDVFRALFPCGSVTGAPKVTAMKLIKGLESSPRGPYCGSIGMIAPPGSPFRARFSVAIRTAVLNRTTDTATYGTGGAITWDSEPGEEYDELQAKAQILYYPADDFQLLETFRWEPGTGLRNLDRHLHRICDSARYFGFAHDLSDAHRQVRAAVAGLPPGKPLRVRLLLHRDGRLSVECTPLPAEKEPVILALDSQATATSRWTRHKTTRRDLYDAAAKRHPYDDDVILLDLSDHVIETTRANLAVKIDGRWHTPPLSVGCLPGIERQRLIDVGRLHERTITIEELPSCEALAVVNSLRGWRSARLSRHQEL
jgi:para-aminobenzoate synthetase / 4-amino-4-deoxychorismate lyase